MQQKECVIVRELLDNYVEELTNETTNQVIAAHLEECHNCRRLYQEKLRQYREGQEETKKKDQRFYQYLRKYLVGGIVGLALGIVTLLTLGVWFLGLVVFGPPARTTDDPKDYQQIFEDKIYSELLIFPGELPESMTDITFSYYYRDTFNTPTVSIFLQGTYDEADYAAEIARLEAVCRTDAQTGDEYVLFTGERQVTYIYVSGLEPEEVPFDEKYLPQN